MGSSDVRPIAKPPAIEVQDSDDGNSTDEEHRLIAGYIILKGGGRTRRLWMAVTDVGVSVEDEKGVKERWSADAIRDATRIDGSSKMTPRGQYGVMLRIEPTAPQNPDGGATLRRQASSTSADLLGLLSPLWGGRRRVLTPGRPRTPSSRRLSGGFGMGSPSAAKPPPKSLEYTLILPTSWEADAWAAAIGESQRAVVQAASQQQWACVSRLLRLGRDVHKSEENGRTALHYACGYGNQEAIHQLLEGGAHVNAADTSGVLPIGFAAHKACVQVVPALLKAGADPARAARCGVWQGKNAIDMARSVGCEAGVSLMLRHCWFQLLPFEIKLLILAAADAPALRAAEAVCVEWQGLIYTGKQMGCLPDLPALPASWHRDALEIRRHSLPPLCQPPLSPRARGGAERDNGDGGGGGGGGGDGGGGEGDGEGGGEGDGVGEGGAGGGGGAGSPRANPRPRHTLVLDLDETLVHASALPMPRYDFSFSFPFGGVTHTMYVRKRPFLEAFFNHLRLYRDSWEVVIFTASVRAYADALLDILDPARELLSLRLYREHCCPIEASYTKDLSALDRKMQHLVLVDNTPISFAYQPQNGVPIVTWRQNDADCELIKLCPLLDELAAHVDVRPVLGRACRVQQLTAAWHRANAASVAALTAAHSPLRLSPYSPPSAASPVTSAPLSPRRRSPQVEADIRASRVRAAEQQRAAEL